MTQLAPLEVSQRQIPLVSVAEGEPIQPGALDASTLGELLTQAAARFGERPALLFKPSIRTRVVSYRALEQLALRTGRYLQGAGVRQGDRVVVWAPNMPEWVQLFFACHKIGAVLVPLDVRSAPSFVDQVMRLTEPRLVVLSRITAHYEKSLGAPGPRLEQLDNDLPSEAALLEVPSVQEDDLAEIMFTSGTTGLPKGVMLSHRNIISNVASTRQTISVESHFRLLSLLPLSHMLEQTAGMLTPLSGGASIVYPTSRQPAALFRTFQEYGATMMVVVPQALQLFLNGIEREARRQGRDQLLNRLFAIAPRLPPAARRLLFRSVHAQFGGGLRIVVCGGAYLDPALARRWELMGVMVLQGYGATEAAPIITGDRPDGRRLGAVGMPVPGERVGIAPDGEVLAQGPNIFSGYWRNPEATALALEGGWYHTGDLGTLDAQEFLHLKGRKKDLIVLANGQNVYPEDVESALIQQPAVADAVVIGLEQGSAVQVHAVLLLADPTAAADAVRSANERLADHQRIGGYTVWPDADFPRTHTLKVKKHEVLERIRELALGEVTAPPPAPTGADDPLRRLIGELASMPSGSIRDEQTLGGDLGLDSLGRVELLSALEQELGAYVEETAISPGTTVAELAGLIGASPQRRDKTEFMRWPLTPFASIARELFVQLIVFPAYHLLWKIRVEGRENLRDLDGPVMVAANHNFGVGTLGLDPAVAWMGLPRALRLRLATAGEEHAVFDDPVKGFLAKLCNTFPLSQEGNVRGSLEYVGRLLDLGWSVLIFPEGKLTPGGPMQPFKGGTGLLATEARAAVVPLRIVPERPSVIEGGKWPGRGAVTVRVGKPLRFAPGTPVAVATEQIEAAVRAL